MATQLCNEMSLTQAEADVDEEKRQHMCIKRLKGSRVCCMCNTRSYWTFDCGEVVCCPTSEGDRGQCWTRHMIDASRGCWPHPHEEEEAS